jgi:hypothetical protein
MKKIFLIIFFLTIAFSVRGSEITDHRDQRFSVVADSLLSIYTDEEFKTALLKTLQRNNATNPDIFIKDLESIRRGSVPEEKKLYGLSNLRTDFKPGMNGWSVAISGILVVYAGLVLIALVVIVFNFALKERPHKKKRVKAPALSAAPAQSRPLPVNVPEDHLVAISAAVELYFRLYLHGRPVSTAYSSKESVTWKGGNKFGMRKNQR